MIPLSLHAMQFFQELHDKNFHHDVYSLPKAQRLNHLHNHLVKYHNSPVRRMGSLPDTLACILSMANTLSLDINKELNKLDIVAFDFQEIQERYHPNKLDELMGVQIAKIAKGLEGLDHIESSNYPQLFGAAIAEMLVIVVQKHTFQGQANFVLAREWLYRLDEVKRKSVFFPNIHKSLIEQYPAYKSFYYVMNLGVSNATAG